MYNIIRYTHIVSVLLFLLIYLVKTLLLVMNKKDGLTSITKMVKVPEMIISFLFLGTGVYMMTQIPEINKLLIIKIALVLCSIPIAIIGFKKGNKFLAVLSLLMLITSYGLAEMSKKKSSAETPVAGGNGQEIFTANCSRCHGDDGKLALAGATDLSTSQLDRAAMSEIVKNGKGAMAGFKETLSEEQVSAVCDYTAALKK